MNVEGGQYSDLDEIEKEKEQRWRQANYRLVTRSEDRWDLRSKYRKYVRVDIVALSPPRCARSIPSVSSNDSHSI
jgi:hypothetical protein